MLLIGPLGINFSEILIEIKTFSFEKMHLKMPSAKWRLFRLGLNELTDGNSIPHPMAYFVLEIRWWLRINDVELSSNF